MFVYRIVLLSVVFYFNTFFLFAVNFVIFTLRATILINQNLKSKVGRFLRHSVHMQYMY